MEKHVFVGVDAASQEHLVTLVDDSLSLLWKGSIPNNHSGCDALIEVLEMWRNSGYEIWIAGEGQGGYLSPLDRRLIGAGFRFVGFHPTQVVRFRELIQVSQDKDDEKDAFLLAEMLHWKLHRGELEVDENEEYFQTLKEVARAHHAKTTEKTSLQQRLVGRVRKYWPELMDKKKFFAKTDSVGLLTLLAAYPSPSAVAEAGARKIERLLNKATRKKCHDLARRLVEEATRLKDHPVSSHMEKIVKLDAQGLLVVRHYVEELRRALEELLMEHPFGRWLLEQPGIGVRTAGCFLGEAGNLGDYSHECKLARYSGIAPTYVQSGKSKGHHYDDRRYNHRLKRALLLMAESRTKWDDASRDYLKKRQEAGDDYWNAIKAMARHLVRCLWKAWRQVVTPTPSKEPAPMTPLPKAA